MRRVFDKYWIRWQYIVAGIITGMGDGSTIVADPPEEILTIIGAISTFCVIIMIIIANLPLMLIDWMRKSPMHEFQVEDLEMMFSDKFLGWLDVRTLKPSKKRLYEEYLYYKYFHASAIIYHDFAPKPSRVNPALIEKKHDAYRDHIIIDIAGLSNIV